MTKLLSRRDVLKGAGSLAAAAAAAHCFPAPAVLADGNPSRKLNVAAIGCGGRGLYCKASARISTMSPWPSRIRATWTGP